MIQVTRDAKGYTLLDDAQGYVWFKTAQAVSDFLEAHFPGRAVYWRVQ